MGQHLPTRGEDLVPDVAMRVYEALAKQQDEEGIRSYGRLLHTFNNRSATLDALEEQVDSLRYTVQAAIEHERFMSLLDLYDKWEEVKCGGTDSQRAKTFFELMLALDKLADATRLYRTGGAFRDDRKRVLDILGLDT